MKGDLINPRVTCQIGGCHWQHHDGELGTAVEAVFRHWVRDHEPQDSDPQWLKRLYGEAGKL